MTKLRILLIIFGSLFLIGTYFTVVYSIPKTVNEVKKLFQEEEIEDELTLKFKEDLTLRYEPSSTVIFHCYGTNEECGRLDFGTGELKFTGKADKSAQVFFEYFLKNLVDNWIEHKRITEKEALALWFEEDTGWYGWRFIMWLYENDYQIVRK